MAAVRFEKSVSVDPTRSPREGLSRFGDLFACSFCYELYDGDNPAKLPKKLPCSHSFCVECIDRCCKLAFDERKQFFCPVCKQKTDTSSFPTNDDILRVIEMRNKAPWSQYCHAACPSCSHVTELEICFDCLQPVCSECLKNHFGKWKEQSRRMFNEYRKYLETCLENIESLKPVVDNNAKKLKTAEDEIEFRHQTIINAANIERVNLLNSLATMKSEQEKYHQFKHSLKRMILDLTKHDEENQVYEKSEMLSRKEKKHLLEEEFNRTQKDYSDFTKSPFAVIDSLINCDRALIGELVVEEIYPIKTFKQPTPPAAQSISNMITGVPLVKSLTVPASMFSQLNSQLRMISPPNDTTSRHENRYINSSNCNLSTDSILTKFINCSKNDPEFEILLDHSPSHLASYKNLLFVCEEYGELSIFEFTSDILCNKKSKQKLNFTNIRNISVNSKYLGATYSYLTKDDIRKYNKKMPMHGIALFRRNESTVCNDMETFIKLPGGSISPRGLVLQEDYIFVADINLAKVYKINYSNTGDYIQKYSFDGQVFDISLKQKFMVVTDYKVHELCLLDVDSMTFIKRTPIEQTNKFESGPHNVTLTNDNLIFLISATKTDVHLYDINLAYKTTFSVKFCNLKNITVLESPSPVLIISSKTNTNKYKLSCFIPK